MACIKDEAPNAEADIETCVVSGDILIANPIIENSRITLLVKPYDADITKIKVDFTLTPGATIDPPSGTVRDFSSPQVYTVTSESGTWKKEYTVACETQGMRTEYDFELFKLMPNLGTSYEKNYYQFYEEAPKEGGAPGEMEQQNLWDSGNVGFAITATTTTPPEEYPTVPSPDGKNGYCAKLVTCSTGFAGNMVKKPIAAGNLFIGTMGKISLSGDPLKATHFGRPFKFVPTYLTGYYKYKAGEEFTDKNKTVYPDRIDTFDIYAIMFETDDEVEWLDGTNSLTSPNLISIARIAPEDRKETDEWTYFSLPFEYLPGKSIDSNKLANNKYSVSVVFSSSIDGAYFEGALGSTLYIDEVRLVHLQEEEKE